jgi:hypothetical protein
MLRVDAWRRLRNDRTRSDYPPFSDLVQGTSPVSPQAAKIVTRAVKAASELVHPTSRLVGNVRSCAIMPARSGWTGRLKVSAQLSRMMRPFAGSPAEVSVDFFGRRLAAPIQRTVQCSRPRREAGDCSCLDQRFVGRVLSRLVEATGWRLIEISRGYRYRTHKRSRITRLRGER